MEQTTEDVRPEDAQATQLVVVAQLRRHLAGLMRIHAHEVLRQPDEVVVFRGYVEGDTEEAFEQITQRFSEAGYTAWLRDGAEGGHEVVASKGELDRRTGRVWVNVVLLLATILSVLYSGTVYTLSYNNMALLYTTGFHYELYLLLGFCQVFSKVRYLETKKPNIMLNGIF